MDFVTGVGGFGVGFGVGLGASLGYRKKRHRITNTVNMSALRGLNIAAELCRDATEP